MKRTIIGILEYVFTVFIAASIAICLVMVIVAIAQGIASLVNHRDSTDGEQRSGMILRTDHGTGCQYLESTNGGITPRLDEEGKHIGCSQTTLNSY